MKLRRYQEKAVWYATRHLLEVPIVLVVMPTGAGKTVVASSVCKFFEPVLWMAHREELLDQAGAALKKANVEHTLLSTSATVLPTKRYNLAVYDEYHHSAARTNRALLNNLNYDRLLSITATPERLDKKPIRYDRIIQPTSCRRLIDQGYLTKVKLFYVRSHNHWLEDLAQWTHKHTGLGKTIFFVKNHAEAAYIKAKMLISCEVVKGSPEQRKAIIREFEYGDLDCLISCLILTEGVNIPICKTVILGRKTFSATMLSQMIGRAMRIQLTNENSQFKPQYCNIIEPATMAPTKRYINTAMVLEPDYCFISTPVNGGWETSRI